MSANPAAKVIAGGTVAVSASVSNPGNVGYSISWSDFCGGSFADPTSLATSWTAPASPATCALIVEVKTSSGWTEDLAVYMLQIVEPPVTVYDGLPAELPPSLPSQPFQAARVDELGELVTLAGIARRAVDATVILVTWDQHAYAWPITLNLYHPGDLVHPFASRTVTFDIPARPPPDPDCTDGRWKSNVGCHYGFAFPITFDLRGAMLPDSFVYGITYDTQSAGHHPTGDATNYSNSLNVGLIASPQASPVNPSIGTKDAGIVYLNGQTAYPYNGSGVPGVFGPDTNWDYRLAVKFTAAE